MNTTRTCKLDADRFRQAVVEKLTSIVGGNVEDTGHHLRITGGQHDAAEVELTLRNSGASCAALVDGKQARYVSTVNNTSIWAVVGAVMERLETRREQTEMLRRQRTDTEKCLLLLKDFPLLQQERFRWNVSDGKAHIEIRASFGPERIKAFMDMVELSRMTLEDGDMPPTEQDGEEVPGEGEGVQS